MQSATMISFSAGTDHVQFFTTTVAPERMARYHVEAVMIALLEDSGSGIYEHIVGAVIPINRALFGEASMRISWSARLYNHHFHGARPPVTEPTGSDGVERDQVWHHTL